MGISSLRYWETCNAIQKLHFDFQLSSWQVFYFFIENITGKTQHNSMDVFDLAAQHNLVEQDELSVHQPESFVTGIKRKTMGCAHNVAKVPGSTGRNTAVYLEVCLWSPQE